MMRQDGFRGPGLEGRFGQLSTFTGTSSPLPSDLREFLTQTLADILVADYQANQGVTKVTGVEGSLPNREPRGRKRGILGEGYKANER